MSPYNGYQFSEDYVSVDTEIEFYIAPDQRILDMLAEVSWRLNKSSLYSKEKSLIACNYPDD